MTDSTQINRYAILTSHATGYAITFERWLEDTNRWGDVKRTNISRKTYQANVNDMRRFYGLSSRLHNGTPYIDITLPKNISMTDYLNLIIKRS
jgi:hypothetical protein